MFTLVRVLRLVVHIFFYRSHSNIRAVKTILFDFWISIILKYTQLAPKTLRNDYFI